MTDALRRLWHAAEGEGALHRRTWLVRGLLLSLAALLVSNAVLSVFFKTTDFEWHLREGLRFWTQEPYNPRFLPYPLPRIMLDGLFLPLGFPLARAAAYVVAVALLVLSLIVWHRLTLRSLPEAGAGLGRYSTRNPAFAFVATGLALLVLHPYLARDLNDCGPHITTMTLAVLALAALLQGRAIVAGLLLATAAVWAATPLLFLPYLLLKRQWLAAAAMAAGIVLWCLSPALVVGWQAGVDYYLEWLGRLAASLSEQDLTALPYEPPRHQSQALRMIFARYATHFGPDHPIHIDNNLLGHPLFVQFLDLPARTAKAAYGLLLLLLGAFFAWRFRRPLRRSRGGDGQQDASLAAQPWILPEWALVLLLMPLLAPTAWLHHFAVALPAALLVSAHALAAGRSLALWRKLALGYIVVVLLLLQRDVVQRELSILVLSYKVDGFAMILLAVLTASLPAMRGRAVYGVDRRGAPP